MNDLFAGGVILIQSIMQFVSAQFWELVFDPVEDSFRRLAIRQRLFQATLSDDVRSSTKKNEKSLSLNTNSKGRTRVFGKIATTTFSQKYRAGDPKRVSKESIMTSWAIPSVKSSDRP